MRTRITVCTLAVLVIAIAASIQGWAQVPPVISYQGVINDPSGELVPDGTYTMSFRLYDNATGGAALYSETQSVEVRKGYFNVLIGSQVPFPPSLNFTAPYYLGIAYDGGNEMTPRTQLASSPYALNARTADGLSDEANVVRSVNGESGEVTIVGQNGILVDKDGTDIRVGLNLAGPLGVREIASGDGSIDVDAPSGPVANLRLADDAVTSDKIADGSVTGADLADGAISINKIDAGEANEGQVLRYNGTDLEFGDVSLTLPFEATVETTDAISITNNGTGSAGNFNIDSGSNSSHALVGSTGSDASWNGPAAVYGLHSGGSGIGVFGRASGSTVQGVPPRGVYGVSPQGIGVYGYSEAGIGLSAQSDGTNTTIYSLNAGTGRAGTFEINDPDNNSNALEGRTVGTGSAIMGSYAGTSGVAPAIFGQTASTSNGSGLSVGATGVMGRVNSTSAGGWSAGVRGLNNSTSGNGIGVVGYQAGSGWGVVGQTVSGTGVRAQAGDGGNALVAIYSGTTAPTTTSENIAIFQAPPRAGGAVVNQARIDNTGRGFFNGGTANAGADVAEMFDVEGLHTTYEPGDVLAISTRSDRTVEKSSEPYSTLVVGVYATKPGVLLMEENIDGFDEEKVPMGIVGVIPTKVIGENGAIERGDLIVTSSREGYAMKADPETALARPGCIIGKALETFDGNGTGLIRVLVNVR